jgi:3-methyladenine DNA glycosylase/8-oxoguanine DNA glycosylase
MPDATSFELPAAVPFDLPRTVAALRRRPTHRVETLVDHEYRRVMTLAGRNQLIGVRQIAPDRVQMRSLEGALGPAERREAARLVDRILGLSFDLAPVYAALEDEPGLAALAAQVPGMEPPAYDSLWVTVVSVVPFQQVSLAAGSAILNRLIERLGASLEHEGSVYYAYPTPQAVLAAGPDALRACGLSQAKTRALVEVAARTVDARLDEAAIAALDDERALAALSALPGIGPWSARLILLRGFRRLSIFPLDDSGAAGNFRQVFDIPAAEVRVALDGVLTRLGPYRGYLYFLLLASSLLRLSLITPAIGQA